MLAGILVISDKGWCGERSDKSGPVAREIISRLGIEVARYEVVPDEAEIISTRLREWSDALGLDLILTSGGTGLSPRDVTPEATLAVVDKIIPGLTEAILSRAVAGSRGKCLIVNLPGSPKAVRECLEVILSVLPHALDILGGKTSECGHVEAS